MRISILKKINNEMPDSMKALFAPFIRRGLINNKMFLDQYNRLIAADSLSCKAREEIRNQHLKETLIHAYEHTRYYKKLFDRCGLDVYSFANPEDLAIVPLLTRQDLIDYYDELQADDITDYYEAITGGSTGTPLKLNMEKASIYRERAFVYHFFHKFGYDYRQSKVASFRGTNFKGKNVKKNPVYNEIQMNPCNISEATVSNYWQAIDKFGAQFLHGFPSAIYSFCKYAECKRITISGKFKAVFCVSENLYDFQKQYIEEVLGCPCTSFYGHTERNAFAEMNEEGLYQFNDLYCYHELTENKEIISTGFINRKMPLIRYVVDDTAIPKDNGYMITGHREGFLYGKNEELLSGASMEVHSDLIDRVISYQLVQREKGRLIVRYIPNGSFNDNDKESFRQLFQNKAGRSLDVEIEEARDMILTQSSKYKLIIQETPITNE